MGITPRPCQGAAARGGGQIGACSPGTFNAHASLRASASPQPGLLRAALLRWGLRRGLARAPLRVEEVRSELVAQEHSTRTRRSGLRLRLNPGYSELLCCDGDYAAALPGRRCAWRRSDRSL